MALTEQTQQTMQAYIHDLLNHGDYARHFSDDVVVSVFGTDQRYRGREAAKQWIEGAHAVGEIRMRGTFTGEEHAAAEAEFVRKDGISVPYSVIYDLAGGKITRCVSISQVPSSRKVTGRDDASFIAADCDETVALGTASRPPARRRVLRRVRPSSSRRAAA